MIGILESELPQERFSVPVVTSLRWALCSLCPQSHCVGWVWHALNRHTGAVRHRLRRRVITWLPGHIREAPEAPPKYRPEVGTGNGCPVCAVSWAHVTHAKMTMRWTLSNCWAKSRVFSAVVFLLPPQLGLRTLCIAHRKLWPGEFEKMDAMLNEARSALDSREERVSAAPPGAQGSSTVTHCAGPWTHHLGPSLCMRGCLKRHVVLL